MRREPTTERATSSAAGPLAHLQRFRVLEDVAGLTHALTTRRGGVSAGSGADLNLGTACGDDPAVVDANRRRVALALGVPHLWWPRQVHGRRVVEVASYADAPQDADAVVVRRAGVLVGVLSADCPLLLLVDPRRRVLALAHSGWRGTVKEVVPAAVAHLVERCGSDPADLRVAVGPSISARRYEVGPEVVQAFEGRYESCLTPTERGHARLDLSGVLRAQLDTCGVPLENVEVHPACTYESESEFYSYRRDGAAAGRHALLAGWM